VIALAHAACRKAFSLGPNILAHMANDTGQRAVLSLQYRVAT
jgi:3-oxoacyl-[acyl-carrier-protein] synthase-1